jgi:hypothetical protein
MAIAVQAGKRKIIELRCPAMLPGNDVLDFKGNGMKACRQPAILTSLLCSLADSTLQPFIHDEPEAV